MPMSTSQTSHGRESKLCSSTVRRQRSKACGGAAYLSQPEELVSGSRCVALQNLPLTEQPHAALGFFVLACFLPLAFEAVIQGQTDLHPSCSPSHHTNLHATQLGLHQAFSCSLDCVVKRLQHVHPLMHPYV